MRAEFRTALRRASNGTDEKPEEEYVYLSDAIEVLEDIEAQFENLLSKIESAVEDINIATKELSDKLR